MRREYSSLLRWLGVALAALSLGFLIFGTPGGFLRKLDYIGAAVCHRRASHSFFIAGHQLPVCQRCTGTFSGALTGTSESAFCLGWVGRRFQGQGSSAMSHSPGCACSLAP